MRISAYKLPLWNGSGERIGETRVDLEDFLKFNDRLWRVDMRLKYAKRWDSERRTTLLLHRLIMGLDLGDERVVDHISHDRLDNRRSNLRVCTRAQNSQNMSPYNRPRTSEHRGVSWDKRSGKWAANVTVNKVTHRLGCYETEEAAHEVARAFRLEHMTHATD